MLYYPPKKSPNRNNTVQNIFFFLLVCNVFTAWRDRDQYWQNACYKSFWWIIPKVLVYCFSQTSALLFGFRAIAHSRNLTINIFTDYFRRQRCKCFSPVCILGSVLKCLMSAIFLEFLPNCKNATLIVYYSLFTAIYFEAYYPRSY